MTRRSSVGIDLKDEQKQIEALEKLDHLLGNFDHNLLLNDDYCPVISDIPIINYSLPFKTLLESEKAAERNLYSSRNLIHKKVEISKYHSLIQVLMKENLGNFTCLLQDVMTFVGTSSGAIIFRDTRKSTSIITNSSHSDVSKQAVRSLAISPCRVFLLSVHTSGICIWNIPRRDCSYIYSFHSHENSNIIQATFGANYKQILYTNLDANGYLLQFKDDNFLRSELIKIYSSKRPLMTLMKPLSFPSDAHEYFGSDLFLVAVSNKSNVFIISYHPNKMLAYHVKYPSISENPATVSWQLSRINAEKDTISSNLACGFHSCICVIRVYIDLTGCVACEEIISFPSHQSLFIGWLNRSLIANISIDENLQVYSSENGAMLSRLDLFRFNLKYNFSPEFSRYPPVSSEDLFSWLPSALSFAPMVSIYRGQISLLCEREIILFCFKNIEERINEYISLEDYIGAYYMIADYHKKYENRDSSDERFLVEIKKQFEHCTSKHLAAIKQFQDSSLHYCNMTFFFEYHMEIFSHMLPILIECKLMDFMFGVLRKNFSSKKPEIDAFSDVLFEAVRENRLSLIPEDILYLILNSFLSRSLYSKLETCLLLLDLTNLDITALTKICWNFKLYNAILHIHNVYCHDFMLPIRELIVRLGNCLPDDDSNGPNCKIGDAVLMGISSLLRNDQKFLPNGPFFSITQYFTNPNNNLDGFSPLKIILKFNARGFFDAISIAYSTQIKRNYEDERYRSLVIGIKIMIEVLVHYFVDDASFKNEDVIQFYIFLANQIALVSDQLIVHKFMLQTTIDYLVDMYHNKNDPHRKERETCVLLLLQSSHHVFIDITSLQIAAERSCLYEICEYIYMRNLDFRQLINLYCNVKYKNQLASKLQELINEFNGDVEKLTAIRNALFECFESLIASDPDNFIHSIVRLFPELLVHSLNNLNNNKMKFYLLQQVFNNDDHYVTSSHFIISDSHFQEVYIELMCEYEPDKVNSPLRDLSNYSSDRVLMILRKYDMLLAQAIVYEKIGNYHYSCELRLKFLRKLTEKMNDSLDSTNCSSALSSISHTVSDIMEFLGKANNYITREELNNAWFEILDLIVGITNLEIYQNLHFSDSAVLSNLASDLIHSMVRYVPAADVLRRITQNSHIKTRSVKEIQNILTSMVETQNYDILFYQSTINIISSEMLTSINKIKLSAQHGCHLNSIWCIFCFEPFFCNKITCNQRENAFVGAMKPHPELHVYRCHHGVHSRCEHRYNPDYRPNQTCPQCFDRTEFYQFIKKGKSSTQNRSNPNINNLSFRENSTLNDFCALLQKKHMSNFSSTDYS